MAKRNAKVGKPLDSFLQPRSASFAPRQIDTREPVQRFLIVCEGAKTEKNYFEAFQVLGDVRRIVVEGAGDNTLRLVERTRDLKAKLEEANDPFDQVWCVFDRDSFPAQHFNEAIRLAEQQGFQVAYSNEAFEIWYLLHFDYHISALSRTQYEGKLTEKLGFPYRKNHPQIYGKLLERQDVAIRHAAKLHKHHEDIKGHCNPEKDNPVTTVHLLVQQLNLFSPDGRRK